ncbi:MAG: GGDEF domain-containing protein [Spirochaetia bacterium]|nr:GGDEF domain-containing protein [Spirochaetia bacterium]
MNLTKPLEHLPAKVKLIFLGILTGVPISLFMGFYFLLNQKILTGAGILSFNVLAAYVVYYLWKFPENHKKLEHLYAFMVFLTSSISLLTNFTDITTHTWFILHPMLIFFSAGFQKGIKWNTVLLIVYTLVYLTAPYYLSEKLLPDYIVAQIFTASLLATVMMGYYTLEVEKKQKKMEHQANFDSLTDLHNRRYLLNVLKHKLNSRNRIDDQNPFSLILFDVDDFKKINDGYGHGTGDEVIRIVSDSAKRNIRSDDVISRWGGEEFLCFQKNIDLAASVKSAEKIMNDLRDQKFPRHLKVTASFGVVSCYSKFSLEELLHRVDTMLYYSKKKGKNTVSVCNYKSSDPGCSHCDPEQRDFCKSF